LFYTAFYKPFNSKVFGTVLVCRGYYSVFIPETNFSQQCLEELSINLATIFLTRIFVLQIVEVMTPILTRCLCSCCVKKGNANLSKLRNESTLADCPEIFDQYNEVVIQFGYVALFASVFPLATLAAFINNIIEIRTDMYGYVHSTKRPYFERAKSVGVWLKIMELMGYIGVLSNACIIAFTDMSQTLWDSYDALLFAFFTLVIVYLIKWLVSELIPDVPKKVEYYSSYIKYQKEILSKNKKN